MKHFKKELEEIANVILMQNATAVNDENKPNYTNREFMNAVIIFQNALFDKLYNVMEFDNQSIEERLKMAERCGEDLRKFIYIYTNLDTHKFEQFL